MIEGLLNLLLEKFGYKVSRVSGKCANEALYALDEYLDEQGSFDYELYRKTQEDGNKRKIDWVWAKEENISFISSYIQNSRGTPQFGICHGTRCGREQEWFRRFLGGDVIGTDFRYSRTVPEHHPVGFSRGQTRVAGSSGFHLQ